MVSGTGSHSTLKSIIYQPYQVSRVESPNDVSKKKTSNLVGKCFTFYFYLSFRLVAKRLLAWCLEHSSAQNSLVAFLPGTE